MFNELTKAWRFIIEPEEMFAQEHDIMGFWPIVRWYLVVNIVLAILTPIVICFGFPCDIIHSGSNAQMGAYVQAPQIEAVTGISRYFWVAFLTYFGNVLKLPIIAVIFHIFAKLLRGHGTILDSCKIGAYSSAPVLLFGWIPYFGLISGLWVGYLYVLAFRVLHNTSWGPTIALMNFMIGVQIVWALVVGWIGSSVPW
jgi:hypothetical protein